MHFHSVNLLPIQTTIREHCRDREMTILSRRFMMRIGSEIAKKYGHHALITGESLGQVASQTVQSMEVIEEASESLIIRPLVGMDKTEITHWAEEIGTYETSILPFEDCCTVFLPPHPVTKPRLSDILASEEKLNVEKLVQDAIDQMEVIVIS